MPAFRPTDEQLHIHDLFRTGEDITIRAGAGTGKTSTLLQLSDIIKEQGRLGLYLAFNRSIADEAGQKFPRQITTFTAHGGDVRVDLSSLCICPLGEGITKRNKGFEPRPLCSASRRDAVNSADSERASGTSQCRPRGKRGELG